MLEITTSIFGLIQSILIMFNKKENWIFYILNITTLTIFSFTAKLYGDVLENIIYLIIGFFGLFTWYSKNISNKIFKSNKIQWMNNKERIIFFIIFILITGIIYLWLIHTDDPLALLDAVTTGLSFVATLTMAMKKVDSWIYWLIDDILMAITYFSLPNKALYLMSLNIIWIFLAIGTIYTWNKQAKKEEKKYDN
jgi:nicotinamide mononucleotide transporter